LHRYGCFTGGLNGNGIARILLLFLRLLPSSSLLRPPPRISCSTNRPREVLSKVERAAPRELKADKDLVIVPADKGRFTVM
uniref:Secreted protein n=1 Tax=Schistocephalus solidus TaxID=70667 RepID=A0A183TEB9_SCHSO